MKKHIIMLLVSTLFNQFLFAQNLVPNPSFEDTVACPDYYGQITNATGWLSYRNTPDYFNVCSSSHVGVPFNDLGFQYARSGNGYGGFITHALVINYREYIGIQLNQALAIGQKYFVTFYVSRAVGTIQHTNFATNKIGARFFNQPHSQIMQVPIDNFAHIYSDSLVSDTSNWVKITGSFVADSAYQYAGFGNFFQDSLTNYVRYDSSAVYAYYFVDDIFVTTDSLLAALNSIHEQTSLIGIFPNPAIDLISVDGKNIESIIIYDLSGREIENIPLTGHSVCHKINVIKFSRGIYFIRVTTSENVFIQKIILIN